MRIRSPIRRANWSKRTSYPTANMERRFPGEVGAAAKANFKNAEQELEVKQSIMENIQRKTLSHMDKQRRDLEKSMVAYSDKMRELSSSRVNDLFRDLHTRNAIREEKESDLKLYQDLESLSDTCSNSSKASTRSLPVNLIGRVVQTRRHTELRTLKGFAHIDVRSPILETRENSSDTTPDIRSPSLSARPNKSASLRKTATILRQLRNNEPKEPKSTTRVEPLPHQPIILTHASLARRSIPNIAINDTIVNSNIDTESVTDIRATKTDIQELPKVSPRVNKHSMPWMLREKTLFPESPPDSAYNSAAEDFDSCSSVTSGDDRDQSDSDSLLTAPTLHVRRRRKRSNRFHMSENLVKQSVLKRAKTLLKKAGQVEEKSSP